MEDLENTSNACRTCLKNLQEVVNFPLSDDVNVDITAKNSNMSLAEIVMACSSVRIFKNDGLPYRICYFCKQSAINAINFKLKSEEIDAYLRTKLATNIKVTFNDIDNDRRSPYLFIKEEKDTDTSEVKYNPSPSEKKEGDIVKKKKDIGSSVRKKEKKRKRSERLKNIVLQSKNGGHKCSFCEKVFMNTVDCDLHVVLRHGQSLEEPVVSDTQDIDELQDESKIKNEIKLVKNHIKSPVLSKRKKSKTKKVKENLDSKDEICKCNQCYRVFTNTGLCRNHEKKCDQEPLIVFVCKQCDLEFSEIEKCSSHVQYEHSQVDMDSNVVEIEKCEECFSKFNSAQIDWLILHRANEHDKHNDALLCLNCNKRFASPQALVQHASTHPGFSFICIFCGVTMNTAESYTSHSCLNMKQTAKKKSVRGAYSCPKCDKTYTIRKYLKRHVCGNINLRKTLKDLEPEFVCKLCQIRFESLMEHNTHVKDQHPEMSEELLLKENEILKCLPANSYHCDICDKNFSHELTLKCHLKSIHSDTKSVFLCPECGKSFKKKGSLLAHGRTHVKDLPFECKICNKRYKYKAIFNIHLRSHTGEKPHKCLVCGKGFRWSGGLIVHLRRHQGVRPYECGVCGKSFVEKGGLTVHSKIHTGETRFECPVCKKGFYFMKTMKKHLSTHRY